MVFPGTNRMETPVLRYTNSCVTGRARTRSFGFATLDALLLLQSQNVQVRPAFDVSATWLNSAHNHRVGTKF